MKASKIQKNLAIKIGMTSLINGKSHLIIEHVAAGVLQIRLLVVCFHPRNSKNLRQHLNLACNAIHAVAKGALSAVVARAADVVANFATPRLGKAAMLCKKKHEWTPQTELHELGLDCIDFTMDIIVRKKSMSIGNPCCHQG